MATKKKYKLYASNKKKAGYSKSYGQTVKYEKGESSFRLTSLKSGKKRVYESKKAATNDGWSETGETITK